MAPSLCLQHALPSQPSCCTAFVWLRPAHSPYLCFYALDTVGFLSTDFARILKLLTSWVCLGGSQLLWLWQLWLTRLKLWNCSNGSRFGTKRSHKMKGKAVGKFGNLAVYFICDCAIVLRCYRAVGSPARTCEPVSFSSMTHRPAQPNFDHKTSTSTM